MKLSGTRFGTIEVEEQDVLTFPDGLVGFMETQKYVLVNTGDHESPFRWLQSLERPELAFLLADPDKYLSDYHPKLRNQDYIDLDMGYEVPYLIYVTANIPKGRPGDMTLNLTGPIIINALNRIGKQVVLEDQAYTIRHRVFAQKESKEPVAA